MLTTNIEVSDGLTNGAMGIITDIILEENSRNLRVILVQFASCNVGEEAKINSIYKHINVDSVPVSKVQASATINDHNSCQGSQKQFPFVLAWVVTIHKFQGLTLEETVVDMTSSKGQFVAFSCVRHRDNSHIVNYTQSQINVLQHVEREMAHLWQQLPELPVVYLKKLQQRSNWCIWMFAKLKEN